MTFEKIEQFLPVLCPFLTLRSEGAEFGEQIVQVIDFLNLINLGQDFLPTARTG